MYQLRYLSVGFLLWTGVFASSPDVSITGTVTDGNNPLEGAVVRLVSDETLADTTGEDGTFELSTGTSIIASSAFHHQKSVAVVVDNHCLSFCLPDAVTEGCIVFFDGNGREVARIGLNAAKAGMHSVALPKLGSGFYILKMTLDDYSTTRKIITTGSSVHIDASTVLLGRKRNGTLFKTIAAEVDQIKVEKEGYAAATVGIESYQKKNIEIVLEEECAGSCCGGKLATTDVTQTGPFEIIVENRVSNLQDGGCMLVRPKEFTEGCLHPVVTWGNGTQSQTSWFQGIFNHLASHGFIVIASNSGDVQQGNPPLMVQAAQWVVDQNDDPSSPMYQKVDTEHIGATGHSKGGYAATEAATNALVMTSVSSCGATGSTNQKGPALILCGQKDGNNGAKCSDHPEEAYNGINNVPVMKAEHHTADHAWCMNFGGSAGGGDPHDMLIAMTAWFRYHLMGDEEYRSWFYGDDCYLCNHENWTVKSKNME